MIQTQHANIMTTFSWKLSKFNMKMRIFWCPFKNGVFPVDIQTPLVSSLPQGQ